MNSQAHNIEDLFCRIPERRRREAYVVMALVLTGKTYEGIAQRHKMTRWYLAGQVKGVFPLKREARRALEKELGIDLEPFLLEGEVY